MEQIKTFNHNRHMILDNLVNEFLKETNHKGYDLLELTIILFGTLIKVMQSASVLCDNKVQ